MTDPRNRLAVGIDLSCWTNQRGYGRYTRNVVRALVERSRPARFVGFVDPDTATDPTIPAGLEVVSVRQSELPTQAARADGRRRLLDVWQMTQAVARSGVDVMFFPSSYSYFPIPPWMRCVVVVHDAIAERWPKLIFPTLSGRLAWTVKSRLACWQANRVVTVSTNAARAIHDHLGVSDARLRVIYEAADLVFTPGEGEGADHEVSRRYGLPADEPYFLFVGGFSPHKNVEALLAAFARVSAAPADGPGVHLALVGETRREVFYSEYDRLAALVEQLGLRDRVTFTGYVPDADLVRFYRGAAGLILPSRDEGFGLPVVEAMTCGCPVITSRAGALPELVGDAGILIDPDNLDEFAAALRLVRNDAALRGELRRRGLQRAGQLSWSKAAAELLTVFREVAGRAEETVGVG